MAFAQQLLEVFHAAKDCPMGPERDAYVAKVCQDCSELKEELMSLLRAHERAGEFLRNSSGLPPSLTAERPADRIGGYKLLQQIGEGGCGIVYIAEQEQPVRRRVALKIIKLGMDTRQVVARFEAERQAVALMDHPNIAKIFDAGATDKGRPFFVMELVRGIKITDYCNQHLLSTRERLGLFIQVCQAVQHAHQKGIIHRDIKPSNILVTQHDYVAVPKIIDFGIAKATSAQQLTSKTLFTAFDQFIGTPTYMSPEQTQLSGLDIDTRTDIYSLGVLLYELLTGKPPFDAEDLLSAGLDVFRQTIREREPMPPSTRLSMMPEWERTIAARQRGLEVPKLLYLLRGDLDWIVMKCLEKDRARRYETANGLAMDLKRHLNGEPVIARPPNAAYRLRKLVHRNKLVFAAGTSVFLALFFGVLGSTWQAVRATRAEQAATRDQEKALLALGSETRVRKELEQTLEREQRNAYFHHIALAHGELVENNLIQAERLLKECEPQGGPDHRAWEWYYLMHLCRMDPVVLANQSEWAQTTAFSPDGEQLASAGEDRTVRIWHTTTGRELISITNAGEVTCLAFRPTDGHSIAAGARSGEVTIWDTRTHKGIKALGLHAGMVRALAFSPDGRIFATAGDDLTIMVWEAMTGRLLYLLAGHDRPVLTVTFSPDGQRLASGGFDTSVRLWDVATGKAIRTHRNHLHPVTSVAFSPDGRLLAVGSFDRTVQICDADTGHSVLSLTGHLQEVNGVTFLSNGKRLASASADRTLKIWDTTTGQTVLTLRGYTHGLGGLATSLDGQRLASISGDRTAKIWDATPFKNIVAPAPHGTLTLRGHTDQICGLGFSPDGRKLATSSWDGTARVWDIQTGQEALTFTNHARIVFAVDFSPANNLIASGSAQLAPGEPSYLKIWDPLSGQEMMDLPGQSVEAFAIAFSPGGQWLATGNVMGKVTLWETGTGRQHHTLQGPERWITSLAFSHDGRRLASLSRNGMVDIHDRAGWEEVSNESPLTFRAHSTSTLGSLDFSPDDRLLVVPGDEYTVSIFNVPPPGQREVPVLRLRLRGHTAQVWGVAFSPSGRLIASGSEDNTVKIWGITASDKPLRTFRGHSGWVSRVAFAPNGKLLASVSFDKTVKIWDLSELVEK